MLFRYVLNEKLSQYIQELGLDNFTDFVNAIFEKDLQPSGKTNVKLVSRQLMEMMEDISEHNTFLKCSLVLIMKELSYMSCLNENNAAEKQKLQNNLMVG